MIAVEPVGAVEGLVAPGRTTPRSVDLHAGAIWWIGRRASNAERHHLAVPDAGRDLSAHEMHLEVLQASVRISRPDGLPVIVDGQARPSPVLLVDAVASISPSLDAGRYRAFTITIRGGQRPGRGVAAPPSGTTVALQIDLTRDTVGWRLAHALAWPLVRVARAPRCAGWTGTDVADRYRELGWWLPPDRSAATTRIGKGLHELAEVVRDAKVSTGRRAVDVFSPWPPWRVREPGESDQHAAQRRNQSIAAWLLRSGVIDQEEFPGKSSSCS